MIRIVLPRTLVVSKIEGEPNVEGLYIGHPITDIAYPDYLGKGVIYLDDIKKKITLKEYRLNTGLKQAEFASGIGVSPSYYFKIEEGHKLPSFSFLKKLKLRYPDIDIDSMFF